MRAAVLLRGFPLGIPRAQSSELPGDRKAGVGVVGAEVPGPDRPVEVRAQGGAELADSSQGGLHRSGDVHPGPLGVRTGGSIPASQAHGTGQFACQEVDLVPGPSRSFWIAPGFRLLELFLQVAEAIPIGLLCLDVECGACSIRSLQDHFTPLWSIHGPWPLFHCHQLHGVDLPPGVGEQPCDVVQSLDVLDAERLALEGDRPVLAVATEDARPRGPEAAGAAAAAVPVTSTPITCS